jgi:hypothetical protein
MKVHRWINSKVDAATYCGRNARDVLTTRHTRLVTCQACLRCLRSKGLL